MKTSLKTPQYRKLAIDFELYTDGDLAFKQELVALMIDNLKELIASLINLQEQHTTEIFRKTSHKVKPTISMLNDAELIETIEALGDTIDPQKANQFQLLCNDIIESLENEIEKDNDSGTAHAA